MPLIEELQYSTPIFPPFFLHSSEENGKLSSLLIQNSHLWLKRKEQLFFDAFKILKKKEKKRLKRSSK